MSIENQHHQEIQHDLSEPNSNLIILVVAVLFLVLVVIVIKGVFLYQGAISHELNKKEMAAEFTELRKLRLYETETLSKLTYIDKEKCIVQIPIDIAMEQVVTQYRKQIKIQ